MRRTLTGTPYAPSRLAQWVHSLLNWIAAERFPILPCAGPLAGYRMKIDWHRYRSFAYGTWEPEVVSCLSRNLRPGSVALDIGAHIGFYTLLLSKLAGSEGMVYSFEPLPENYRLLSENVELNHCGNVRLFRKAILSQSGVISVTVPANEPVPGSVSLATDYGTPPIQVEGVTLDEFAAQTGQAIHLVKMDVEGAEHDVLVGGRATIQKHRPALLIELHHFDGGPDDHPVLALLRGWNYGVEWLNRMPETSHIFCRPLEGD